MIKIVVGGQLAKKEICELIESIGKEKVVVTSKNDMQGAMDIKTNSADYYFGCCNTGGGGSLAMAIALNGLSKCLTVAMPGKVLTDKEMLDGIERGVKAFGFVPESMQYVVPFIVKELLKQHG